MLTYLDGQIELHPGDARDVVPKLGRRFPVACFHAPYRLTSGGSARSSENHKVMSGGWMADYDNSGWLMVCEITWKEIMQSVVSCLAAEIKLTTPDAHSPTALETDGLSVVKILMPMRGNENGFTSTPLPTLARKAGIDVAAVVRVGAMSDIGISLTEPFSPAALSIFSRQKSFEMLSSEFIFVTECEAFHNLFGDALGRINSHGPGVRNVDVWRGYIRSGQVCSGQVCFRQARSRKDCSRQIRSSQRRSGQVCIKQVRSDKRRSSQVRFGKVCSVQDRSGQVRNGKACSFKVRSFQVSTGHLRMKKLHFGHVQSRQIRTEQVCIAEIQQAATFEGSSVWQCAAKTGYHFQGLLQIGRKRGVVYFGVDRYRTDGFDANLGSFADKVKEQVEHKTVAFVRIAYGKITQGVNASKADRQVQAFQHLCTLLVAIQIQPLFGQSVGSMGEDRAPECQRRSDDAECDKAKISHVGKELVVWLRSYFLQVVGRPLGKGFYDNVISVQAQYPKKWTDADEHGHDRQSSQPPPKPWPVHTEQPRNKPHSGVPHSVLNLPTFRQFDKRRVT